jgi:hypothetical protein
MHARARALPRSSAARKLTVMHSYERDYDYEQEQEQEHPPSPRLRRGWSRFAREEEE